MPPQVDLAPDMRMKEVIASYPGAQRALFSRYHIGGCASCAFRPEETLEELCQRHENLPVDEVIAHLHTSHQEDLKRQIEPIALKKSLEEGQSCKLLDVRTREEHESVSINGAILFTQEVLQKAFGSWKKDEPIVIYDHQGGRNSMDATAYLEGHGYTNVRALRGGIDAYSQEADPTISRYRLEIEE